MVNKRTITKKITIILRVGAVILITTIGGIIIHNYKVREATPINVKNIKTEKPPNQPKPLPPQPKPSSKLPISFPLNNIPVQRKHSWGGKSRSASAEEKTIIKI